MNKYTGHIDTVEERNRGTPSVDIPRATLVRRKKIVHHLIALVTQIHPRCPSICCDHCCYMNSNAPSDL